MRRSLLLFFVMFVLAPSMLSAQGTADAKRKFGLTFPNIGVIWHISDDIAFLPGISFQHSWSNYGDDIRDSWSNSLNVDASLRFYIQEWKGLRFYLSPRYTFGWGDAETTTEIITGTTTTYSHGIAGVWGIQYAISDRISIFGDIGAKYTHASLSGSSSSTSQASLGDYGMDTNGIGTLGTWVLILYLK